MFLGVVGRMISSLSVVLEPSSHVEILEIPWIDVCQSLGVVDTSPGAVHGVAFRSLVPCLRGVSRFGWGRWKIRDQIAVDPEETKPVFDLSLIGGMTVGRSGS